MPSVTGPYGPVTHGTGVRVGLYLPTVSKSIDAGEIVAAALTAERAGADSLWASDHVAFPVRNESHYPYGLDAERVAAPGVSVIDPLAALTLAGAVTERIRLGTGVLLAAARRPLELAHRVASVDALSEGRLLLGLGPGWLEEEMAALGVDPAERGARTDEAIEIMRAAWRGEPFSHEGRFERIEQMALASRPHRPGGPPIWIGGTTGRALRRVARHGDGWLALDLEAEAVAAATATLDDLLRAEQRERDAIEVGVVRTVHPPGSDPGKAPSTAATIPADGEALRREAAALAEAGADLLVLQPLVPPAGWPAAAEWLCEQLAEPR